MTARHRAPHLRRPRGRTALVSVLVLLASLLLGIGSASATVGFSVVGGVVRYDIDLPDSVALSGRTSASHLAGDPVAVFLDGAQVATGANLSGGFDVSFTLPAPAAGQSACGSAKQVQHSLRVVVGTGNTAETSGTQQLTVVCPDAYALRSGSATASGVDYSALAATPTRTTACLSAVVGGQDVGSVPVQAGGPKRVTFQVVATPARDNGPGPDVTAEVPTAQATCYSVPLPPVTPDYAGTLSLRAVVDTDGVAGPTSGDTVLVGAGQTLLRSELVNVQPYCTPNEAKAGLVTTGSRYDPGNYLELAVNGTPVQGAVQVDPQGLVTFPARASATGEQISVVKVDGPQGGTPTPIGAQRVVLAPAATCGTASSAIGTTATLDQQRLVAAGPGGTRSHTATGSTIPGATVRVTVDGVPVTTVDGNGAAAVVTADPSAGTYSATWRSVANETCGQHVVVVSALRVFGPVGDQSVQTSQTTTSYETVCPMLSVSPGVVGESTGLVAVTIAGTGWSARTLLDNGAQSATIQISATSSNPADPTPSVAGTSLGDQFNNPSLIGSFSMVEYLPASRCGSTWTLKATQPAPRYDVAPTASTSYQVSCPGQAVGSANPPSTAFRTPGTVVTALTVGGYEDGQQVTITYDGDASVSQAATLTYTRSANGEFRLSPVVNVGHATGACGSHLFTITPVPTYRTPSVQNTPGGSPSRCSRAPRRPSRSRRPPCRRPCRTR